MIARGLYPEIDDALTESPAVALLGPGRVGKTTLALEPTGTRPSEYLDLESSADRAKLAEPVMYLQAKEHLRYRHRLRDRDALDRTESSMVHPQHGCRGAGSPA
ncbi:hypothetical protein [Panacagrimonas sp.]|uniref:hypothetical protein n=1 Tax=Panacagrimonas sp. TaxID=2480088 RepID=UPI003B516A88